MSFCSSLFSKNVNQRGVLKFWLVFLLYHCSVWLARRTHTHPQIHTKLKAQDKIGSKATINDSKIHDMAYMALEYNLFAKMKGSSVKGKLY